jgi:hypothetical protein
LLDIAAKFKPYPHKDAYLSEQRYRKGGIALRDEEHTAKMRSAAYEVIKQIGAKFYKLDFNLAKISFPIKCMEPRTIIQQLPLQHKVGWMYLNYAASVNDPIERMKALMASNIAFFFTGVDFRKPLNPVLGETF